MNACFGRSLRVRGVLRNPRNARLSGRWRNGKALHQRPEIVAHPYVRLQALRGASLEAKRVLAVDSDNVPDIGAKGQTRIAFLLTICFARTPVTKVSKVMKA